MAVYSWVYGFGHLQADCRGLTSAPESYICFEDGTTLSFSIPHTIQITAWDHNASLQPQHNPIQRCAGINPEFIKNSVMLSLKNSTSDFYRSLQFNGHFSWWTWVSRYQNVSILDFIGAKDDGVGGNNWSYKMCKSPDKSSPPTNHNPSFLQAGCPRCRPTNSVRAQKHFRLLYYSIIY